MNSLITISSLNINGSQFKIVRTSHFPAKIKNKVLFRLLNRVPFSSTIHSLAHDHFDKFLIVDVSRRILLAVNKSLDVFFSHFLPKRAEHVPELCTGDETVPILVEMPESFNKIINSVLDLLAGNGLQNGKESLESYPTISLLVLNQPLDL